MIAQLHSVKIMLARSLTGLLVTLSLLILLGQTYSMFLGSWPTVVGWKSSTLMMQALFLQFVEDHGNTTEIANGGSYREFMPPHGGNTTSTLGAATAMTIQTVLSVVIADAISRIAYVNQDLPLTLTDNDPRNLTVTLDEIHFGDDVDVTYSDYNLTTLLQTTSFNFTVQRYGYGYGWNQNITINFGLGVLCIYLAFALLYMGCSIWFWALPHRRYGNGGGKGWMSSAWGEAGELLALELVSPEAGPRGAAGRQSWCGSREYMAQVRAGGRGRGGEAGACS